MREELEEVLFDVMCPPDLLQAHLGTEPGEKLSLDPTRVDRERERWTVRIAEPYRSTESFALSASGFAKLLQRLYDIDAPIDELPFVQGGDIITMRCTYDNTLDNPFLVEALSQQGPLAGSLDQIIQGPLADTLTHTGQLAMLRGMAGAPVKPESYARAAIVPGRVGLDQAPPGREFDGDASARK